MSGHISKIARMLRRDVDVEEHILNISSHQLTFFQKLVLCRDLKFAIPQNQNLGQPRRVTCLVGVRFLYVNAGGGLG